MPTRHANMNAEFIDKFETLSQGLADRADLFSKFLPQAFHALRLALTIVE